MIMYGKVIGMVNLYNPGTQVNFTPCMYFEQNLRVDITPSTRFFCWFYQVQILYKICVYKITYASRYTGFLCCLYFVENSLFKAWKIP